MTTVRVEAIHPKCLASLPGPQVLAGCECKEWEGHQSWWLCAHHDSFNDGCWAVADAEPDSPTALIEQLMQIAHGNALFNGGFGDRDPVVGFSLIMAEWNRICAENDNYETGIERLKELVDELSEKTSFLQAGCLNLSRDDLIELVADPHRNRVVLKGVSRSQVDMVLSWIEEGLERLNRPKGDE